MINLILKPHRDSLHANSADVQKLFVLLKVIPAPRLAQVRPPLALALVIDTSGSMRDAAQARSASKLKQALEATKGIINDSRLVESDLVSIIQFSDVARVILPLSQLSNRRGAHEALAHVETYSGGTKIAQGMLAARQELARIAQGGVAQRVLLLTDGQAFDADECPAAARRLAELNAPLVTIGVGEDYNEELLRDLAEIGLGRPYHIQAMEQLSDVFQAEVQSSVREVITSLQAKVHTVAGVTLDSVTRVYPDLAEMSLTEPNGEPKSASLGNIQAGDYTVFVLELTVTGRERNAGRARLAQVQLTGAVSTSEGTIESPQQDIVVSFTDDTASVESVDSEVLGYVQQRNADRLVQKAVRQTANDVPAARQTLKQALDLTRRIGNPAVTRLLQNSLTELDERGKLSSQTRKTMALETRTHTIKTQSADNLKDLPSEDEIHRLTGA